MSFNGKIAPGPTRLSEGNELVKVDEELEIEKPPRLKIWEFMAKYIKKKRTAKIQKEVDGRPARARRRKYCPYFLNGIIGVLLIVIVILPFISILTAEKPQEKESTPRLDRRKVFLLREYMEVLVIRDVIMFDRGVFVQKMKGGVYNSPTCRGFIIRHCSNSLKNFDQIKYNFYFDERQVHTEAED